MELVTNAWNPSIILCIITPLPYLSHHLLVSPFTWLQVSSQLAEEQIPNWLQTMFFIFPTVVTRSKCFGGVPLVCISPQLAHIIETLHFFVRIFLQGGKNDQSILSS